MTEAQTILKLINKTWERAGYTQDNAIKHREVRVAQDKTIQQGGERENETRYREDIEESARMAVNEIHHARNLITGFMQVKTIDPNHTPSKPVEDYAPADKVILKAYTAWANLMDRKSPVTRDIVVLMGEVSFDQAGKQALLTHSSAKELLTMSGEIYYRFKKDAEREHGRKIPLSKMQNKIYNFYKGHVERTNEKPPLTLIQSEFKIAKSTASEHITKIREKNWYL